MTKDTGRTALERALILAGRAIERRSSVPILDCVLVTSDGGRLTFEGSDLDTEVAVEVPAPSLSQFMAAAAFEPVRRALDWHGGEASFREDGGRLYVGEAFMIPTNADEFPRIKPFEAVARFTIDAAVLLPALKAVAFAMSTEETRYYLNGAFFHALPGGLRIAAIDGHRAHIATLPLPAGLSPDDLPGSIVTRKAVHALIAALELPEAEDADVELSFSDSASCRAAFHVGPVTIRAKLIDGAFPDYVRVIPTANDAHWTVNVDELARAADAAIALKGSRGDPTHMAIDFAAGVIRTGRPRDGYMCLPLVGLRDGNLPGVIGCNAGYLKDVLAAFEPGSAVRASMKQATDPILFQGERSDFVVVLMPTRVAE